MSWRQLAPAVLPGRGLHRQPPPLAWSLRRLKPLGTCCVGAHRAQDPKRSSAVAAASPGAGAACCWQHLLSCCKPGRWLAASWCGVSPWLRLCEAGGDGRWLARLASCPPMHPRTCIHSLSFVLSAALRVALPSPRFFHPYQSFNRPVSCTEATASNPGAIHTSLPSRGHGGLYDTPCMLLRPAQMNRLPLWPLARSLSRPAATLDAPAPLLSISLRAMCA